jgi:hypothetical protein
MPKVYAPQVPARFDTGSGLWIPSVDLGAATQFGEIVECLPPGATRLHTAQLVVALKDQMSEYSPEDFVIAVGDPSLIAAASVIAYKKVGYIQLLKWDRLSRVYIPVTIKP